MTTPPSRVRTAIGYLAIGLVLPWPQLAAAQEVDLDVTSPISVVSREEIEQLPRGGDLLKIFDLHNQVRAEHGSPPLRWNPMLADSSQEVANRIAETGNTQHSSRVGRENIRENIVAGPFTPLPPIELAQTWIDELPKFVDGVFPDICMGDWSECSHISQILWSTTTDVGCGYAADTYVALVCHYSPKGNIDGKLVLELRDAPVIAINNTPEPAPVCEVPPAEDWVAILNAAAMQSGFAQGSADPRDATTERQWDLALRREQDVQNRLMTELATLQGNVGTHINAYLAATSAWQENYVYLASRTTTLQGQLTEWLEAKEVYEDADFHFAMANLGVGGVKLGFKAYRFLTAPRAAATGAAAGATQAAGAADEAVAAAETGVFNRTLIPPGQNPNVPGMAGFTGTASAAGNAVDIARANWQREVDMMRRLVDDAVTSGDEALAATNRAALDDLLKAGPKTPLPPPPPPLSAAERAIDSLDQGLVAAAREAGVNIEGVLATAVRPGVNLSTAVRLEAQNQALMRAIAGARGWHTVPPAVSDMITNVLIQARKGLAGVDDAPINPQLLSDLHRLKAMADARGINLADWMRKAAGEVSMESGQQLAGATEGVLAIVRYFDDADIDLLLKVLDTAGDLTRLRNAVSPVAQASLNGLGRAAQAGQASCGALETGLGLAGAGAAAANSGAPAASSAPLTDAQLESVLYGTGKLGEVGLGNVVDQFGVTDRFTAGQGLPRAIAGELWELITSPSATVASHYFTHQAQGEYLDLLQTERDRMVQLGTKLAEASSALRDLQNTLQRAGLSGPGSYLGTRGPADLRKALDDLEKVYRSGSDQWQRDHKDQLDARRDHINQKLAALAETVTDLNALAARMAQMRNHLDSLRLDPAGGLRGPVDLFNPIVFVRLGSISLFLRGMGADAFGLSTQPPFQVAAPPPPSAPGVDFDTMRAREAERWRAIDEAPEVEVETDFDEWLESLPPQ